MEIKKNGEEKNSPNLSPGHVQNAQSANHPRTKKVLVIDDDTDFCQAVQMMLEYDGYNVCCAMTGSEGLEMAVASKPDLIILDIMMENMWAGYEVNQALKFQSNYESLKKVPIVMVSSIEQPPAQRFLRSVDAHQISPDVYLTKPLDVKKFMATVHSLCPLS